MTATSIKTIDQSQNQELINAKALEFQALIANYIKQFGLEAAIRIVVYGITEGHPKIDDRAFAYPLSEALEHRMNELSWHYPRGVNTATLKDVREWVEDLGDQIEISSDGNGEDRLALDYFTPNQGVDIVATGPGADHADGELSCRSRCGCVVLSGPLNRETWDKILAESNAHKCDKDWDE